VSVEVGAVLATDPALEALLACGSQGAGALVRALGWRASGRAELIAHALNSGALDPAHLPFRSGVLEELALARSRGSRVVLIASESPQLAQSLADSLGTFDAVTDTAPAAAHRLSPQPTLPGATAKAALGALRPHQWTKNALLFIPALLAHTLWRAEVWSQALWAFAAFSLCASSVYVLNDLLDLRADRAHPRKRQRPFASGALPLGFGLLAAPLLLVTAGAIAWAVSLEFLGVLGAYYAATVAYSLWLKRLPLIDVLLLAGLYTVRILAGSVAYQVPASHWLLAFSLFLFVSLALVKRYSELLSVRERGLATTVGRGYRAQDLELLASLGASAGYMAVLVLALYVQSADVTKLYGAPERLWLVLPAMLYWISRVWLLAHRGQVDDDPIVFAIRDKVSYAVAAAVGAVLWASL
jgi:4-hydroxybenzoate polyprenyltransferase